MCAPHDSRIVYGPLAVRLEQLGDVVEGHGGGAGSRGCRKPGEQSLWG